MKKAISFIVVFTLLIGLVLSISSCSQIKGAFGKTASDFELVSLYGETIKLSDFKGKVIILDFWATWCPPCRKEIPHFVKLHNEYKDKGVVIIGISLDREGPEKVKMFCEGMNVTYPVVMGNSKIVKDYGGIRGIPTTFIINKKQKIVKKIVGYTSYEVFKEQIEKLL